MGQLEQTPLSKFVADALGWFLLVAAVASLIALIALILPLFIAPQSSYIYEQVSVYLSASDPLVLASSANAEPIFSVGSEGRLLITCLLAILALGAYGSFLGAMITGAIDLFYFSGKSAVVDHPPNSHRGRAAELESVLRLIHTQEDPV